MNSIEKLHLQSRLSPERRALLEHMYAEQRAQRLKGTQIPRQPIGEPSPLSFVQERLWFMAQLDPHNALYNEHTAITITGELDIARLEMCFNKIIERHEILRTIFTPIRDQKVQQQVLPEMVLTLHFSDISMYDSAKQHIMLSHMDAEWSSLPFDLLNGPLLRVKVIKLQPTHHSALITLHHSISDGWSIGLLTQEILTLYAHQGTEQEPMLPALPIQYHDFAYWQRHTYEQEILAQQLIYWKQQLAGPLPYTEWPVDQISSEASSIPNYQGAVQHRDLPPQLMQDIQALCTRLGITSFMFFLTTLALLLARHTHQDDLLLGSPIAGRTSKETEHLIGCFINTLALRIDLSGEPTFEALLARVKTLTSEAYAHQEVPFEKIVQELQPERTLNRTPLFNILFNFNNTPQTALELADMHIERTELSPPIAKFPLTIYVNESPNGTQLRIVYQTELYSHDTIQILLDHYHFLLSQVVVAPRQSISAYSLLSPATSSILPMPQSLLPNPYYPPVTRLINEQVHNNPEHIALSQGSYVWSYATLLERATSIAQLLLATGLQSGEVVAVRGARSFELIAAMFGVFLSGGVLLSIDVDLPLQRQKLMLREAKVHKLLLIIGATETSFDQQFLSEMEESHLTVHVIAQYCGHDELYAYTQSTSSDRPLPHLEPHDPAYIFFTSGTTGKPKGVLGTHQGLSHFLHWQRQCFTVSPGDRCAQLTGPSFDVVLRDIFLPLVSGATLVLPEEPKNMSARAIVPWLAAQRITIVHTTPSIAQSWLTAPQSDDANTTIRLLFLAGESLTRSLVQDLRLLVPDNAEIVNLYGPTETSLAKCYRRVQLNMAHLERPRISIGQPLPETHVYILSPQRQLCGIGEIGEIVIRTPFRSLGYINAPKEQQAHFIANPFRDDKDDILYLTGDYGRYLADGTLDILGRLDKQIKIHGVRIEPQEVAVQLSLHPAIRTCVVHVGAGLVPALLPPALLPPALIAYVVPLPHAQVTSQELRDFLGASLPATFLPSAILMLDSLPLTTNGKVDLQALPPLTPEHFKAHAAFEAPETPTEEQCAAIWSEVLNLPVIGRRDNFFALGGHSLLAMDITARLEERFHIHIPLKTIFIAPTIIELAQSCEQLMQNGHEHVSALPKLVPQLEQRYEPFPLTDIQQAYWAGRSTSFEMGNIATHNYSEFIFNNLDLPRFQHALQCVIQRHDMLRATIHSNGLQQILAEVPPYTIIFHDLQHSLQEDIELHLTQIRQQLSHQVFPLDRWPFFELQVSQVSETRFIVHISIDALICDAWSRQIIGRELLLFYMEPHTGLSIADTGLSIAPLHISFRDYVLAEQALRSTELYQKAKAYWLERLETLPPAPELPLLLNPKTIAKPHFVRRSGRLAPETWQKLQSRARALGITPSALICAAYIEILTLWSKNKSLTINLTLFNRLPLHPQVNELIGDFTSLTLLSTNDAEPTFAGRAKAIHTQLMEDIDQRAFSGIEVLRELNRRRGTETGAIMPVVLTSTLGSSPTSQKHALDAWYEGNDYGISQTPQVYIDHAVSEQRGALVFRWDTVQEIFPEGMIDDMFSTYEHFLQRLADQNELWHRKGRTHLLPVAHRDLQNAANATQAPFSPGLLHRGFLAQAQAQPDALAVITAERCLSYQELDRRSAWLARQLFDLGARPNHLIAVCMDKGWEQIVAVLAILRAGAAYLPIDPELPAARRQHLFTQGEVRLILTQSWIATTLEWPETCQCLIVSNEKPPAEFSAPPTIHTTPTDLAYVIYTSGSTGLPKGVMIDHQGALNTIEDINQRFTVGANDRVLALSALNFDLSVYDIFGLLAAGGSIVMPSAHAERDPTQWLDLITTYQVSIWNTVPTLLEMLVEHVKTKEGGFINRDTEAGLVNRAPTHRAPTSLTTLRLALLSGDWIKVTLPARVWQIAPAAKLTSLGGATEASIWSIFSPIEQVKAEWQSIPYGKALRNQSWQVLNEDMEPCPIWVPGQLYIGGIGLAQGYWRDTARTEASFITHPKTHERLYRTGDMGRYMPDGQIEFLGREDLQVKIQGHRIELGEIEANLETHLQVQTAIVLAQGTARGRTQGDAPTPVDRSLVAYIMPHSVEHTLQTEEIRNYLRSLLPDYMLPKAIVFLDSVPLTTNGKIDRQALAQLDYDAIVHEDARGRSEHSLVVPRTAIEEQIASAFALTLECSITHISLDDNFFMLGGNSISAIHVMARLNALFDTKIPLRALFEAPTVISLAQVIERAKAEQQHFPPMHHVDRSLPLSLSLAQERIWFLCKLEPNSSFYNIPAAVKLHGPLNQNALEMAVRALQQRHETLRTIFPTNQGRATQVILADNLPLPLKVLDSHALLDQLEGLNVDEIIAHEVDTPFDLEHWPALRIALLRLHEDEHVFIVTMHHIISDAWSIEVFIRELIVLYEAFAQGQSSSLSPLPYQFADFAAWQRDWVNDPAVIAQLDYWRTILGPVKQGTSLQTDYPRTASHSFRGERKRVVFTEEQTLAIRALAQSEQVTPFIVLLSAYAILLSQYRTASHEPIAVNTSIAHRSMLATEGMIGFFLSTLILTTDLSNDFTVSELLAHVRNRALEAYNHQDIPFEQIVKEMHLENSLNVTPFSRVAFGLRNVPLKVNTVHDLTIEPLTVQRGMAKFDLELQLSDGDKQIIGFLEYNAELFKKSTINRIFQQFMFIVSALTDMPHARLDTLLMTVRKSMEEKHAMEKVIQDNSFRKKLLSAKPKTIRVSQQEMFTMEQLTPAQPLPLVIKPTFADLNLAQCIKSNQELINQKLVKHGGLLFRGFSVPNVAEFQRLVKQYRA